MNFSVKRIGRNETVRRLLCWLVAQYIRLCRHTGRWQVVNGEVPERLWGAGQPFVMCFWHGRLMMMPYAWDYRRTIHTLTSDHPDGRLIAQTTAHFGLKTVIGSATRGGAGALRQMVRLIRDGSSIGITPDGPRGPRMRAKPGAVALARLAGVPIVPVTYAISARRLLKSWDRFVVPRPFARGVIVWGEPFHITAEADATAIEAARRQLENSLNTISAEADRLCGTPVVEPAPEADPEPVSLEAAG